MGQGWGQARCGGWSIRAKGGLHTPPVVAQIMHTNGHVINTEFALNAPVLALEGVPNPGPVNWGNRLPEQHATSPDTQRETLLKESHAAYS